MKGKALLRIALAAIVSLHAGPARASVAVAARAASIGTGVPVAPITGAVPSGIGAGASLAAGPGLATGLTGRLPSSGATPSRFASIGIGPGTAALKPGAVNVVIPGGADRAPARASAPSERRSGAAVSRAAPTLKRIARTLLSVTPDRVAKGTAASGRENGERLIAAVTGERVRTRGAVVGAAVQGRFGRFKTLLASAAPASGEPEGLQTVPAPNAGRARAAVGLFWTAQIAGAILLNLPIDNPALLVLAGVMSPMISVMWQVFAGYGHPLAVGTVSGLDEAGDSRDRLEGLKAELIPLAKDMGVPMPEKIHLSASPDTNAHVQGFWRSSYELTATAGLLGQRPDIREAVLRHELSHIKHRDTASMLVQVWLAPAAPMLALMAGAATDSILPFLATALLSVFGFPYIMRVQEYLADQGAAASQGGSGPLIEFFRSELAKEKPRSLLRAWLGQIFRYHPAWEFRISRLRGLSSGH